MQILSETYRKNQINQVRPAVSKHIEALFFTGARFCLVIYFISFVLFSAIQMIYSSQKAKTRESEAKKSMQYLHSLLAEEVSVEKREKWNAVSFAHKDLIIALSEDSNTTPAIENKKESSGITVPLSILF